MKNAFYFPVTHNATFGERITALRKEKGIKSVQELAEKIFETFDKYKKTEIPETDNATIESIRKRIASHLRPNCNPKMEFIKEYCDYFHCEADFLLGYIDFPTRKIQSVYDITGLNEKTIDALEMMQLEDRNENAITIIQKNATEKQIEQIITNPSTENMKHVPSGRPLLMDLLNFMFENGNMESLVMHFRDYINVKYKIPVYYDNDKHTFVYPDNNWTKSPGLFGTKDIYWLNFASSEDKPNDCSSIPLTNSFFDTVILKDIENVFNAMREEYEEKGRD